ncbi:MAG: hypothetical protein M1376_20650 [Planctomycetes bacterium]|nr:hypothetical protein [Planctomycetota bacterium]
MEQQAVHMNESSDFLCPSCGAAAFEVVDQQWDFHESDAEEFLVLRCLACLELFYHPLGLPEPEECLLPS